MNSQPIQLLYPAAGTSLGASGNSSAGNISQVIGYSIQAVWSAGSTPVGVLKLQSSNDGSNWNDISGATANVSGDTGSAMFNVTDAYYNQVRLVYTRTSGSGTINASLVSKV